jgi:hypothetical protein
MGRPSASPSRFSDRSWAECPGGRVNQAPGCLNPTAVAIGEPLGSTALSSCLSVKNVAADYSR